MNKKEAKLLTGGDKVEFSSSEGNLIPATVIAVNTTIFGNPIVVVIALVQDYSVFTGTLIGNPKTRVYHLKARDIVRKVS